VVRSPDSRERIAPPPEIEVYHLFYKVRSIDSGRRVGLVSVLGIEVGALFHVVAAALSTWSRIGCTILPSSPRRRPAPLPSSPRRRPAPLPSCPRRRAATSRAADGEDVDPRLRGGDKWRRG
jgi:hypothetical protein